MNMNLNDLSWSEVKRLAKEKEVPEFYRKTRSELIRTLEEIYANEQGITTGKELLDSQPKPEGTETKKEFKLSGNFCAFKSLDGKQLEVSINKERWKGLTVQIPVEYADDAKRLLTDGGYLFLEIDNVSKN